MSKFAALKGKKGPSAASKISASLTAGNLSEALDGELPRSIKSTLYKKHAFYILCFL